MKTTIILSLLILTSCTSPQHIRSSDYYYHDWSVLSVSNEKYHEATQYSPVFSETSLSREGRPTYEHDLNYYFFGLYPSKQEVKMSDACSKNKFRQAYVDHSFLQATVSLVTFGIYTPRTIKVWCENEKYQN